MDTRGGFRRALGASVAITAVLGLGGSALAAQAVSPSIRSFSPSGGKVGSKVTITGAHFTGASVVKIGAMKTAFKVGSASTITATVPANAKSGKISVTTSGGTALSAKSFVVPASVVVTPTPTQTTTSTYAPNGSGTLTASISTATAGSGGNTIVFTYTAAPGGLFNGALIMTVPAGWSAPVTTATQGCVSGTSGVIATSQQTIDVFNLTLKGGATATFTYGATSGGSFTGATCNANSGAVAPAAPGAYTFTTMEKSTSNLTSSGGLLSPLANSPTVTVS
jgi:hypothetical protein